MSKQYGLNVPHGFKFIIPPPPWALPTQQEPERTFHVLNWIVAHYVVQVQQWACYQGDPNPPDNDGYRTAFALCQIRLGNLTKVISLWCDTEKNGIDPAPLDVVPEGREYRGNNPEASAKRAVALASRIRLLAAKNARLDLSAFPEPHGVFLDDKAQGYLLDSGLMSSDLYASGRRKGPVAAHPEKALNHVTKGPGQHVAKEIELQPHCFISYGEADEQFATRLYNDLSSAGIPCWKWNEDARNGRDLWAQIDEAIKQSHKVILIASVSSLNRPPVIREIKRAILQEDERQSQKCAGRFSGDTDVLFPVQLDEYLPQWQHYLKADVTTKKIADARGWQDLKIYLKFLETTVKDLKGTSPNPGT